jgi:flavin reductase (DIM6/NTAB) family NADH-FMN oxidoreductase RutF
MSSKSSPKSVTTLAPVDPAAYRDVLGHYPTGVTVVTAFDGAEPIGMVVGTFTSVSLDPPLVAFMPTRGSGTYARLAHAQSYCINVLAHDQLEVCRTMAVPRDDKFDHIAWQHSAYGAPSLDEAVAQIHCTPESEIEAGDHYIVLCRVQALEVRRAVTPLLFFQGGYGGFSPAGMAAKGDADLISAIRLADAAQTHVTRLAQRLQCEAAVLVGVGPDELTTAFSAYGGSAEMVEPLGERIPLIPPIGEAYVAGAASEVVERWLAKVHPQDEELVGQYRARLAAVARDGVAVSILGERDQHEYEALRAALREYGRAVPVDGGFLFSGRWPGPTCSTRCATSTIVCAVSAGVHAALIPPHAHESTRLAVAFSLATVMLVLAAVALTLRPAPAVARATAALLLGMAAAYVLSRTTGIPGLIEHQEPVDLVGVVISCLELVGAVVAVRQTNPVTLMSPSILMHRRGGFLVLLAGLVLATALSTSLFYTRHSSSAATSHSHSQAALGANEAHADFQDQMRKLWEDHVTWTRLAIVTFADGSANFDTTAARLLKNQDDIGDAIKPFYGEAAGEQLTALLKDHIGIAVQLLQAAKAGDSAAFENANTAWYANANDIADFLAKANPRYWPQATMRAAMKAHLEETLAEASHELTGPPSPGGADLRSVMDRMGHSLIQTTQKYLHALPNAEQRNLDAFSLIAGADLEGPVGPA